jgi:hypothetical protein
MIWPRVAQLIIVLPAFVLIVRDRDPVTLVAAATLIAFFGSLAGAAMFVGLTESMHRGLRSTGMGLIYALTVAVFGGATQPMLAWLIHATGDPLIPAWSMVAALSLSLVASLSFRESAYRRLNPQPVAATTPA